MTLTDDELKAFAAKAQTSTTQADALESLRAFDIEDLARVLPVLWATGGTGANLEAYRDGVQALLAAKLADKQVGAMAKLEAAIDRFNRSSTVLAIVIGLIAVGQLVAALMGLRK